jgi:hypothetical protein
LPLRLVLENAQGGDVAMVILLGTLFVSHYLFANIDVYLRASLPVILLTGAAIPGVLVKEPRCFCAWNRELWGSLPLGECGQPHSCQQRLPAG